MNPYPNRLIKVGETDNAIVKAIQNRLTALGIGGLEGTGSFGEQTKAAVKQFQATHPDRFGNLLIVDGIVGAITWEALFNEQIATNPSPATGILSKAIEIAISQIGVMEEPPGSNDGAMVREYLKSTNTAPRNYWCAAFVYWCFKEAAEKLGATNPLYKTAGCLSHWNNTKGKKITKAKAVNNPKLIVPGSIFIKDHGGGYGHTGIVTAVNGGFIETIEGNSNPNGSSNGIGVFRISFRKINSIEKGFIIY